MFLFTDNSPVTFRDSLPDAVDVVIIGGGVIGISTAWYLRKLGYTVLVCDKGRVAGEQSSRNWGWIRVTLRDAAEVPVAIDSSRCWEEISAELDEDIGFKREGAFFLAEDESEIAAFETWRRIALQHDRETQIFPCSKVSNYVGGIEGNWIGGVYTPSDARAEPFKAVPAMARGVQNLGGYVREACAVRTIEQKGGRISEVVTEHGPVKCAAVVCAAGAWSSFFLSNMGISMPQLVVRGTVARTAVAPIVNECNAGYGDIYLRRRQDGGYTVAAPQFEHFIGANSFRFLPKFAKTASSASDIGLRFGGDPTQQSFPAKKWTGEEATPSEKTRVLNPKPSESGVRLIRANLRKRVPALAEIPIAESWAGMIDAAPDVVPVMDEVPTHPGLFLATGFSGHGFGIGPGAGKIMANLVAGNDRGHDLTRFRFSRFSDGSKILPGPAI